MELCCDLEVDINGEQTIWVNKSILSCFSGKLRRLLGKKMGGSDIRRKMKITFHDFPGGPNGFELIARFCYSRGDLQVSHKNILILNHLANFMEMDRNPHGKLTLIAQTEKFLEGFDSWTWSELLLSLKHSQNHQLFKLPTSALSPTLKLVDELARRLALLAADPSSKCTSFRSSCDSSSIVCSKPNPNPNPNSQSFWFFQDLCTLNVDLIEKLVKRMLVEKFEHSTISKLLLLYQRSRLSSGLKAGEKIRTVQAVINLLSMLDRCSVPIKGLFETLRKSANLKLSRRFKNQLELLIGSQLDRAALDDLMVRSPMGKACVYDVEMVLRLLKIFVLGCANRWRLLPMKRVGRLMDLYAMEVAPDVALKPSKFAALVLALPDSARDSCDRIYHAIDVYLEVHRRVPEEDSTMITSSINYEKLSSDALIDLAENAKFPIAVRFKALIYQDLKLKSPSKCAYDHLKPLAKWLGGSKTTSFKKKDVLDHVDLHKYLSREKQSKMAPKLCCSEEVKYLPRLCS